MSSESAGGGANDGEIADVLIVGAGPSGSVVATELAQRGFSVVCLEQGRWVNNDEFPGSKVEWELLAERRWNRDQNVRQTQDDYPVEVSESEITPVMFAGVGGSSLLYGGHWMRLMPSDFRMRTLDGVADDWPLTYADLSPYYDALDVAVGVSGLAGDPAYPPGWNPPLPPHPIGKLGRRAAMGLNALGWHWWPAPNAIASHRYGELAPCARWGTCETGCPEGAKASFDITHWPKALKAGAKLVTGARVHRITTSGTGLADGAVYFDRQGREHRQRARVVVLAANGVGTPRLLLLSASAEFPDGLANSSGLVGRRLMLHPNAVVTGIFEEDLESWLGPAGQLIHSLEFYETDLSRGFAGGAKLEAVPAGGPMRALELHDEGSFDQVWGATVHERIRTNLGHLINWGVLANDLPEESNYIDLDPDLKDSDGIPAPRSHYRVSENSWRQLRFNMDRVREANAAAGGIRTFDEEVGPFAAGHLLGTARMGSDPRTSVVDAWGVCHDVPNLCVVDGSVMTTGGGMNPTATITALALRTAVHLASNARWQKVPA
jgi:choline dehydrogenase-like flavoprotein